MKVELEAKIDQNKVELEGKIAKLDQKFNFMIILMIIALTLVLTGVKAAEAATYYWATWNSYSYDGTTYTLTGTITTGADTVTVTYTNTQGVANTGGYTGYQLSGGSGGTTNYYSGGTDGAAGTSPYTSATVENRPDNVTIIQLEYPGSQTLTFSKSIADLAFAFVSLNGTAFSFDRNFNILSYGDASDGGNACGYWGCGTATKTSGSGSYPYVVSGTNEPHGTLQFPGSFSSLTWTSGREWWHGFTVGIAGTAAEVTTDTTAPTVTISPANGTTNVLLNSNITITFNEEVRNLNDTPLTSTNVDSLITLKVSNSSGADIPFDATIDSANKVITINPTSDFSADQIIYVAIGASVEDTYNNAITATSATITTGSSLPPTVDTTAAITSITATGASSGGTISADGGSGVTARGVCWSIAASPTTADTCTTDGTGTGSFTSTLSGLNAGTLYYVRAYATNAVGTAYGPQQSFTTLNAYTVTPSAGAGGSISPSTAQTVNRGETTTFTVTPSVGYTASVGGTCGGSLSGTTYTTNAITANCTVAASFTAILPNCTYSLSTSSVSFSATGGSGSFSVNQNESSCANSGWTAASNSSWITITSGSSGNWSVTPVTFTVSANTTNAQRTGAITITGQSNSATMTITQNALLTLSPTTLNYGTLKTSESATLSVTVTNISGGSLTISSVNITGADSTEFTLTNNCNTLSTNGSCALGVRFGPTSTGSKTAMLTITANSITFTAALRGTADNNANQMISVSPSEINDYVDIEFSHRWVITISNPGTGTLLIQSMRFYGDDLHEYTVTGNCSLIRPQESCSVSLTSAYASNQAKNASLVITSNASNTDKLEIPVNMASQRCISGSISISPVSASASSDALTGALTVTAIDNCWWMASSNAAWISADTANWFQGNGTVNYTVSANTASASRIGTVNVGGIPFTIIQYAPGVSRNYTDISGYKFEDNINALYSSGVTGTDANFNPDAVATKEDIAVFIVRAVYGEDFAYTQTPYFSDVPADHQSFKYVQKIKDDNITKAEGIYGISNSLLRSWAAAFIIREIYGEDFSYPTTPYFSDVQASHAYFKYIQKMKERGFTHMTGEYLPEALIPRDALAGFIAEGFLGMEH